MWSENEKWWADCVGEYANKFKKQQQSEFEKSKEALAVKRLEI